MFGVAAAGRSLDLFLKERAMAEIPCIDLAPSFSQEGRAGVAARIRAACETVGFFTIIGHGVPDDIVNTLKSEARDFFALPLSEKEKVPHPASKISRGYFPPKHRALSYSLGKAAPPDWQEGYACGPFDPPPAQLAGSPAADFFFAPNIWPADRPSLRAAFESYFRTLDRLSLHILRLFALALGMDWTFFDDKCDRSTSVMRVIWYPPQPEPPEPGQLRAGEHSDYGTLTILKGEDVPGGLQVKLRDGEWVDVHPQPDAFVCNIGDLMMRWTNDAWVSNLHRVANPPREYAAIGRMSIPFFHNPNADAWIECIPAFKGEAARHPPVMFADHYLGKHQRAAHMSTAPVPAGS
jgi:isopenicillin N synthase-like dioxygenase